MKIVYIQEVRKCMANENCKNSRHLIRDYKVMIDGEHRADFHQNGMRMRGYRLHDVDGRAIVEPGRTWSRHLGAEAKTKGDFDQLIVDSIALIPTTKQLATLRKADKAEADQKKRDERAMEARQRAERHALSLLKALAAQGATMETIGKALAKGKSAAHRRLGNKMIAAAKEAAKIVDVATFPEA